MHSISAHTEFYAYGKAETSTDNFMAIIVVLVVLVACVAVITAYRNKLFKN
jgi:ABC-type lipoprotein release transport system permease subunit